MTTQPRFITAQQVAEMLAVSRETVLRWAREGTIPSYQLGGSNSPVRFEREAVEVWLKSLVKNPAEAS